MTKRKGDKLYVNGKISLKKDVYNAKIKNIEDNIYWGIFQNYLESIPAKKYIKNFSSTTSIE